MKTIKAFAPATIANFNVGYDVLGVALSHIGDEVELAFNGKQENRIVAMINGEHLPVEADKNCCSVVVRKMQEHLGVFSGVDIRITKGFASGSGLGSSSASSAAAAFAYNELTGRPFTRKELVAFAAEGERVACGSAHVDNVAPSVLGGIVLAKGKETNDLIELPIIENLYAVTLFPDIKINTSDSRKILKDHIPLKTASKQVGLMGAFVSSLYDKDLQRFSSSLQDLMIEPMRSLLIPEFYEMKTAAMAHHALAFGISGSGPSVFAVAEGEKKAQGILTVLREVYRPAAIKIQTHVHALGKKNGAKIINRDYALH